MTEKIQTDRCLGCGKHNPPSNDNYAIWAGPYSARLLGFTHNKACADRYDREHN